MKEKLLVLLLDDIAEAVLQPLRDAGFEITQDQGLAEQVAIIIVRSSKVRDFDQFPNLVLIVRAGAGTDNIDKTEATKRGVIVLNTPGANADSVKELLFAMMVILARKMMKSQALIRAELVGMTDPKAIEKKVNQLKKGCTGHEIGKKNFGVIGLGRIGALVAEAARNLDMEVFGCDPWISSERQEGLVKLGITLVDKLEDLVALVREGYLTVHVPAVSENIGLVNSKILAGFEGYLLNTSRYDVVDDAAILELIRAGQIIGYGTDFPTRWLLTPEAMTLVDEGKLLLNTHLGATTIEASANCATMGVGQIIRFFKDRSVVNGVNVGSLEAKKAKSGVVQRLFAMNSDEKGAAEHLSRVLREANINIRDIQLSGQGEGAGAVSFFDIDSPISEEVRQKLEADERILWVEVLDLAA